MHESQTHALADLEARIAACRICLEQPRGAELPHEPRPVVWPSATARLCIAGQAPGKRVHETGIPFNDRSGDRLRDWMGLDRETFYDRSRIAIVPMGFCFPGYDASGSDLPPRRECAATWRQPLFDLMPQIDLVLVIGLYAQRWHMPKLVAGTVTDTVKSWRNALHRNEGPALLPLPHPSWRNTAWLKRNPWFEAEVVPELRARVARLIME